MNPTDDVDHVDHVDEFWRLFRHAEESHINLQLLSHVIATPGLLDDTLDALRIALTSPNRSEVLQMIEGEIDGLNRYILWAKVPNLRLVTNQEFNERCLVWIGLTLDELITLRDRLTEVSGLTA